MRGFLLLCAGAVNKETDNRKTQQQPFPNYSLPFSVCKNMVISMEPGCNTRDPQAWNTNGLWRSFIPDIVPDMAQLQKSLQVGGEAGKGTFMRGSGLECVWIHFMLFCIDFWNTLPHLSFSLEDWFWVPGTSSRGRAVLGSFLCLGCDNKTGVNSMAGSDSPVGPLTYKWFTCMLLLSWILQAEVHHPQPPLLRFWGPKCLKVERQPQDRRVGGRLYDGLMQSVLILV